MTSFLTGGLGALNSSPRSREAAALDAGRTTGKSFVNKDFVKNMAFLNNTVDTHTAYLQKLQAGVDSANENVLEQIQGFWGDLFVLFAGLEPTGIEIGDVKYIIQGLGAFLGINPDTPFPLNLFEAAWHFFSTYIIPLDQFTDVIFDAILAWAVDLGLSEEFIQSITELRDAIAMLGESFGDLFNSIGELLGAFGFLDWTSMSGLGELWDALVNLIDGLALEPLKPVLSLLADLGIPFINALTAIVNTANAFLDPLGAISGGQISNLGQNVSPTPQDNTTVWSVGGDATNAWVFDPTLTASSLSPGSFTTYGTGVTKRLATQKVFSTSAGKQFTIKAKLRWASIPSAANDFGIVIIWYTGLVEHSQTVLNISAGHGSTGGWAEVSRTNVTAPANVDGFKIGAIVGTTITSGQVWVDDISVQLQGKISRSIVDGLDDILANLLPFNFFDDIIGVENAGPLDVLGYFTSFLTSDSPLDALNIFNLPSIFAKIPISWLSEEPEELLDTPSFDEAINIAGAGLWHYDPDIGRTTPGSARTTAAGVERQLISNVIKVAKDDEIDISIHARWVGLLYTGTPFRIQIEKFYDFVTVGPADDLSIPTNPVATQENWVKFGRIYKVPAGVNYIAIKLFISDTATAGTIWFDDASAKKTGLLRTSWIPGLDIFMAMLDQVFEVLEGVIIENPINQQIQNFLNWFLGTRSDLDNNREGLLGLIDGLWGGFRQLTGVGLSIGDVANAAADTSILADTGVQIGEWNNAVLSFRKGESLLQGSDPTEYANFSQDRMFNGGTDPVTINAAAGFTPMAFIIAPKSDVRGFIHWIGKGFENVTALYIDLYKFNHASSLVERFHTSSNLIGMVGNNWAHLKYNLAEADRFEFNQGEEIAVGWRVVGTGTHSIAGVVAGSWLPPDTVVPLKPAAIRTGTSNSTMSFATLAGLYSNNIPWFGLGIIEGDAPPLYYAPRTQPFTNPGAGQVYTIPPEFRVAGNKFDFVGIGGGKGGGGALGYIPGTGGGSAKWATPLTLTYGVEIPLGTTQFIINVGTGGDGGFGAVGEPGGNGTATTVVINGVTVITCNGASHTHHTANTKAENANSISYLGRHYQGGQGGGMNDVGGNPGGGGGGGISWTSGKRAGHGAMFVTARQP